MLPEAMQRIVVFCHHNTQRLVCSIFRVLLLFLCFMGSARVSPCWASVPPLPLFRGCCYLNCCSLSIFYFYNIILQNALSASRTQSRAPPIELLFLPRFVAATACYRRRRNFQLRTATACFLTYPPSRSSHRNLPSPPSCSHRANVEASVAQPRSRRRQLCSTVATVPLESPFEDFGNSIGSRYKKQSFKSVRVAVHVLDELKEKLARIYDVKDADIAFVFKLHTHFGVGQIHLFWF
ncbi:hypothetical protein S245_023500 [Arachis hypogaea]